MAGVVTLLGSRGAWANCSTVGCDSPLQALDVKTGIELGYGVMTEIAGILLVVIGLGARRILGTSSWSTPALALALLVIGAVSTYVLTLYVLPAGSVPILWPPDIYADGNLSFPWPPGFGAILTAAGGLIALAASLGLRAASHADARLRRSDRVGPATA